MSPYSFPRPTIFVTCWRERVAYETFVFMRNHLKFTISLVFGALLLLGAAPAYAAPPTWGFVSATLVDAHSANVTGTLTPNGVATTCVVQYGETTRYGDEVPCSNGPFSGTTSVLAHARPRPLKANTTYHFRFVARNADGSAVSRDQVLTTTVGTPPTIETVQATFITDSFVGISGLIRPNGLPTTCFVEFGLTAAYGTQVDCVATPLGDTELIEDANLLRLSSGTTYHYRMVLQNADGVSRSEDRTVTTCAVADPLPTGSC